MRIERAKNLTDESIGEIVDMIDTWSSPKLTWELLIQEIKKRLKTEYTRQALFKHERILRTYQDRKKVLAMDPDKSVSTGTGNKILDEALERIKNLNVKVQRLESENNHLLEQFILWRYNASVKGITMDYLSQPLPNPMDSNTDKKSFKQGKGKTTVIQKTT
jgi:hypothetical protein